MASWLAVMAICVASIAAAMAAALVLEGRAAALDRAASAPGLLVDIGERRLHIHCAGAGPTVVLEAGGATPALLFRGAQTRAAAFARVCLYDRAGFGWSDPAATSRGFEDRADDLFRMLQAAELPGPYVLVGESFGGFVVRAFARRHPEDVRAMLLVDSPEEELVFSDYAAFRRGAAGSLSVAPLLARLGILRRAVMKRPAALGLPASLPLQDRLALTAYMTRPGYWRAARGEVAAYDMTPGNQRVAGGMGSLQDIPLTVIAHGRPMKGALGGLEPRWRAGQERLASLSSRGRLVVAENSAHDISLTDPDLVAREIGRLLAEAER